MYLTAKVKYTCKNKLKVLKANWCTLIQYPEFCNNSFWHAIGKDFKKIDLIWASKSIKVEWIVWDSDITGWVFQFSTNLNHQRNQTCTCVWLKCVSSKNDGLLK